jgi:hypothetical protein
VGFKFAGVKLQLSVVQAHDHVRLYTGPTGKGVVWINSTRARAMALATRAGLASVQDSFMTSR